MPPSAPAQREPHAPAHPALKASVTTLVGYLVIAGLMIGGGYLLIHVLVPGAVGSWDLGVNRWFVTSRTATLNSITAFGSMLGATLTVIGIAIVAAAGLAIARRWRAVGFLLVGLALEVSVFLTTAIVIDRPRPSVPRLDVAPPTSSFPSGHTAAAIVLYVGLAVVANTLTRSSLLRCAAWLLAIGLPIFVGISRMYRGMHHPTDVMGSVILGMGALIFAHLAVGDIGYKRPTPETARDTSTTMGSPRHAAVPVAR
jgi:membrane-associated phospholipid phosphatase